MRRALASLVTRTAKLVLVILPSSCIVSRLSSVAVALPRLISIVHILSYVRAEEVVLRFLFAYMWVYVYW